MRSQQSAEYVHLRDPRAVGFEPERAISRYRGTSDRADTKTYAFTYRRRANLAGEFRVGPATLQSLYAPEFAAYSSGETLRILPSQR